MAVIVVDTQPDPSVVKKSICKMCGVTLQYVPYDVKKRVTSDYDGGKDIHYYINCPCCNSEVLAKV